MATVNQVFPSAPMGRRVTLTTCIGIVATLFVPVVALYSGSYGRPGHVHGPGAVLQFLGTLIPVVLLVPSLLYARSKVAQFRIEENVLVVRKRRYPLKGLVSAERDREVMRRARKRLGNGGMGCISGKFRSERLGKFEACLTDPDYAVVLRWPDEVLAVSPADPEFFIYSARAAAGLR